MFKKITLKNGLRLILVPDKNSQTVTVLILVATGSKYENKQLNGISHFLEHMFFKGTKKRKTPKEIAETLDKVGGSYNAFTSEEYTGYFAKVEKSHLDLALDWVSDIFLNSTLPREEMEKERGVIIEEINMHYDNPMSYLQILWPKLLYGDQSAGWPITGEKETVMRIKREDLISYRDSQYVASNTLICLAGNFSEKKALLRIKKYFSKIKVGKPKGKPKVIESQKKPNLLLHYRKTDQIHLALGVRAFSLFHPQKYSLQLLASILGGMMSSRLFIEIREKLGIAYYVDTVCETNPDTGFLVTFAGVEKESLKKAISVILREYRKIKEKGISKEELKKAKENAKGKLALSLETSDAKASFYGFQEILKREILTPKQISAKIEKIKEKDIAFVAKEIFKPQKLNLALIGPFKEKESLFKLLKI